MMDYTVMDAFQRAKTEIAEETGISEEEVWKILKKIIFMYITRI